MKKLAIVALGMMVSCGAFSQVKQLKEAVGLANKGQVAEAAALIASSENAEDVKAKDKAAAYNALALAYFKNFMDEATIQTENIANKQLGKAEKPVDLEKMHTGIYNAFLNFLKSDEFDAQPDEKGKVKLKYRAEVSKTYWPQRPQLINAGQYYYTKEQPDMAKKIWGLYLDTKNVPLFEDHAAEADQYAGMISYYISFLSYQTEDFETFKKYSSYALADPEQSKNTTEISVAMLQNRFVATKSAEDSLAYLTAAKAAHEKYPDVQRYFNAVAQCLSTQPALLTKFMDEEIAKNPNAPLPYQYKGDMAMNDQKYDEAIPLYAKVVELDAENVAATFNLGVCYYNKANSLKDQLADKKTGGLTTANADKVKAILADAQKYLEKTRELDPGQETCRWAYILGNVYYVRGENDKYEEVSKMVKN